MTGKPAPLRRAALKAVSRNVLRDEYWDLTALTSAHESGRRFLETLHQEGVPISSPIWWPASLELPELTSAAASRQGKLTFSSQPCVML